MMKPANEVEIGDVVMEKIAGQLFVFEVASTSTTAGLTSLGIVGSENSNSELMHYVYSEKKNLKVINEDSDDQRSAHGQFLARHQWNGQWN